MHFIALSKNTTYPMQARTALADAARCAAQVVAPLVDVADALRRDGYFLVQVRPQPPRAPRTGHACVPALLMQSWARMRAGAAHAKLGAHACRRRSRAEPAAACPHGLRLMSAGPRRLALPAALQP
jgi:hypothetical protein